MYSNNVSRHAGKAWIAQNEARGWEEAEEGGRARGAPKTVNFPRQTVNLAVGSKLRTMPTVARLSAKGT